MKILLTGGGTGGHITPLLAVAHELKQVSTNHLIYVGERKGKFVHLTQNTGLFDESHSIFAGKFRRYNGESFFKRFFDLHTNLLNLRDFFYFGIGTVQGLVLLKRLKPDVVFLKGGFVGVPIGLACAVWKIPFVTHDSDALPGLANRIVGRWATLHATGMPAEYYRYPAQKVRHVGVLVGPQYTPVGEKDQRAYKEKLGYSAEQKLIFITGGSHGAGVINKAIVRIIFDILDTYPDVVVVHQVGKGKLRAYNQQTHERLDVKEFVQDMYIYSGAAYVIVTRAGANTLAEFGVQGKACIVIPNPLLTGGHQLKNAQHLENNKAAVVVREGDVTKDPRILKNAITELLDNPVLRAEYARNLQGATVTGAAAQLASILTSVAERDTL